MKLIVLKNNYSILKFADQTDIPSPVYQSDFYSVTQTRDEISVVSRQSESDEENNICSIGWRILTIEGQMDLSLIGVIAAITQILKEDKIPVFVISTFNTDYILIRQIHLERGIIALEKKGYRISVED